ncbi:MAG: sialidase family protein, partial [Gemmatimonadota bacterium]|nr:sialidase family protein [Gemmatimonadota bacterium]
MSVALVQLEPGDGAIFTGTSVQFVATAVDEDGRAVPTDFSWESSDSDVLDVAPTTKPGLALVRGVGVGEATLTVAAQGTAATAYMHVSPSLSEADSRASTGTASRPHEEEPSLAVDPGGTLYAGWQHFGLPCCVLFSRSSDGGAGWSRAVEMPPHTTDLGPGQTLSQKDPWLVADESGAVYFSWLEKVVHLDADRNVVRDTALVRVARSDDGGGTWHEPVNVQTVETGSPDRPVIAVDMAGRLYAGYSLFGPDGETLVGGDETIHVTRSLDRGVTWSTPVEVARGNVLISQMVARADGLACAAWRDLDASRPDLQLVRVGCSADEGRSWRTSTVAEGAGHTIEEWALGEPRYRSTAPGMALAPTGHLFVTWIDPDWNVVVSRSDNDGASWSEPAVLNDVSIGSRWQPGVTV